MLFYGIRTKAKRKLKETEINYSSSLSKLEEKKNNKHKTVKRPNAYLHFANVYSQKDCY